MIDGARPLIRITWARAASWRSTSAHVAVLATVLGVTAAVLYPLCLRGWIPHDEGTLAQTAHRVLLGQLPHRDFDELYTGGLTFAHAAAFMLWGENLASLRFVLLATALPTVALCYYIASRFTPPAVAGLIAITTLAWSFPNYPVSMPSWYNLSFALAGSCALLRYIETDRRRWILIAGLCGGLSVAVKIIGVYFLAAGALFLIVRVIDAAVGDTEHASQATMAVVSLGAVALLLAIVPFLIMRGGLDPSTISQLAIPVAAIGVAVAFRAWQAVHRGDRVPTWAEVSSVFVPFAAGAALPIASLVLFYAHAHAVPSLIRDVFILPQKRVQRGSMAGAPPVALLLALPMVYVALTGRFSDRQVSWTAALVIAALQSAAIVWGLFDPAVSGALWLSLEMLGPLLVVIGAAFIAMPRTIGKIPHQRQQQLVLLLTLTGWVELVQFPFRAPIYFCYAAPFIVLSAAALVAVRGTLSRRLWPPILLSYLALGFIGRSTVVRLPGFNDVSAALDLPRAGGLLIGKDERETYMGLAHLVDEHALTPYVYVTPDAPEVYFLTGRENPTRTISEVFDEPVGRTSRILAALNDRGVNLVVVNRKPEFTGTIPRDLYDSLVSKFPKAASIGKFEIHWRF